MSLAPVSTSLFVADTSALEAKTEEIRGSLTEKGFAVETMEPLYVRIFFSCS